VPETAPVESAPVESASATFCATLVDEWIARGVRHAVVAPGSRSTPLALALTARPELAIHVFHDERSASFAALGLARATRMPAVLICTSGTAAAHFHAAVAEADLDEVPMIVCTADRPPELRDVAAPQAIDQNRLFGAMTRWFTDPGVPDNAMRGAWRSIARRSVWTATGERPGPVHLNLPFREPLVGNAGKLPPLDSVATVALGARLLAHADLAALAAELDSPRGVIVAGGGNYDGDAVLELAGSLGWPVLADARSPARRDHPNVVGAFDALVRHPRFAADHKPLVVLRVGFLPASKVLSQWIGSSGAAIVHVHATAAWIDPDHVVRHRVVADVAAFCRSLVGKAAGATGTPWLARWRRADDSAQASIDRHLAVQIDLTEPAVARAVVAAVPNGGALVVSSSMPIRDVEWFSRPRNSVSVFANRGANGIDGVISTAIGVALAEPSRPVTLLIGDVAFLHDSNGLIGLAERAANLTVVAVDNRGGGIFSFLPQAGALPTDRFEQLFGTPHTTDLAALAAAHGVPASTVATFDELHTAVAAAGSKVVVVRVGTDRTANVKAHDALNRAIIADL
jgi:2-succinyl-5-enolpyruvyl-6-hydroxy-3-cyclohexene-1-carboxylate synthase